MKKNIKEGYNGWTNWETWVVNLWMDNDGLSNFFGEQIEADPRLSSRDLGKAIEEYYDDEQDRVMGRDAGLFGDIVTNTLKEVNWTEIADGVIVSYR